MRTTFYDKKNSLWRQPTELTQLDAPDTSIGGTWIPAEGSFDANDEAEKVSFTSPGYWQNEANYNIPFMRTTFYDKKHSVWRQPTELVQGADTTIGGTWIEPSGNFDANDEAEKVSFTSPGYW